MQDALVQGVTLAGRHDGRHARGMTSGPHVHHDVWELYHVDSCFFDWNVDGKRTVIPPRSWLLVPPGMKHGETGETLSPGTLHWFHMDRNPSDILGGGAEVNALAVACCSESGGVVVPAQRIRGRMLEDLFTSLQQPEAPFAQVMAESSFRSLLAGFMDDAVGPERPALTPIRRAARFIDENPGDDSTIEELATQVGVPRAAFSERFLEQTGMAPLAYRICRRILAAKEMLEGEETSIATIAQRLGFGTSQHFATVFRKMTETSPTVWRRQFRTETLKPP